MNWLILFGVYSLFCVIIYITIGIIELKVPENHPFKKWWRKHFISKDLED
jgi:hypothetical protein